MKTIKIVQKVFLGFVLAVSIGTLVMTYHLVTTRQYTMENLIIIAVFILPVIGAVILSTSLLFEKQI